MFLQKILAGTTYTAGTTKEAGLPNIVGKVTSYGLTDWQQDCKDDGIDSGQRGLARGSLYWSSIVVNGQYTDADLKYQGGTQYTEDLSSILHFEADNGRKWWEYNQRKTGLSSADAKKLKTAIYNTTLYGKSYTVQPEAICMQYIIRYI